MTLHQFISCRHWTRAAVVLVPGLLCAALVVGHVRGAHADGQSTLGVGNVVSTFDATTESFNVFRLLQARPPLVAGVAPRVVLVDHPAEADFAVTGTLGGQVQFDSGDPPTLDDDFTLRLDVWKKGKRTASHTTQCQGSVNAKTYPAEYRYGAIAPCVQAQLGFLTSAMSAP